MNATTTLTGANLIAGNESAEGRGQIAGVNPVDGSTLAPFFHEATEAEISQAVKQATAAFVANKSRSAEDWAMLLETIADEIEALGDTLINRVMAETGLPEGRVRGERGRTMGQLRLFASVTREGSWVDARIETALPDRAPIPRPDIRSMLRSIGPVAVFGASNFPLAFSVAGGDTASALAAGCPVVCKAHPAHPGTSELVGRAIGAAVAGQGFHPGTFSLVHGAGAPVGLKLVQEPGIAAVGFTGSLTAGRAIFDAAAARATPVPVFAEMGSTNPVFLMPAAIAKRGEAIAAGLAGSVTLGSGQFCTNPGLVFAVESPATESFAVSLAARIDALGSQTMLHKGIADGFSAGLGRAAQTAGVSTLACGAEAATGDGVADAAAQAQPCILKTSGVTFAANPHLHEEVFGPASILVVCADADEMTALAANLDGSLTGTVHMEEGEIGDASDLVGCLEGVVGRVVVNGFPTGVEVSHAMHHGGPYPSTTAPSTTSVGTRAILRFARPVCYQDYPEQLLPAALTNGNPQGIVRMINGERTRETISSEPAV
ncbi:MAG: alpha-ketoglutaric semialdehyde dehydrogenase [Rhodothermales bacterium]|jgi:alpha-ketoglutaric semialdehyde dehydrogenase